MKKLTTLFLSLASTAIMAQIPNPSFESWTSGMPDNWQNPLSFVSGIVTESNTAHAGSHSASLNSASFSSNYYGGILETGKSVTDPYFANSGNPAALNGWYQLTTSGGDYFAATASATSGGSNMGAGAIQVSTATSVWKQFSVCITYTTGTADSMSIIIQLGNSSGNTHAGSFALVDDLSFGSCVAGVQDISKDVTLEAAYPNPASQTSNIIYSIPSDAHVTVDLYDISGRKVMPLLADTYQTVGRYKIPVDVTSLANGIYIYRVTVNGQSYAQKLTVAK